MKAPDQSKKNILLLKCVSENSEMLQKLKGWCSFSWQFGIEKIEGF